MPAASIIRSALAAAAILICAWAPASATTFTAQFVAPPGTSPSAGLRAPGLHIGVIDGQISLSNAGGNLIFGSGQFGYMPRATTPPILVPASQGLQFALPPAFGTSLKPTTGTVDCEVR